jgi:spermidine/putrescine transport system substrate-binding protein
MSRKIGSIAAPSRRDVMKYGASATAMGALFAPNIARAQAPVEINLLAWYGHGEPDVVGEFEAKNNVKFKNKYYAGGDNMLALIAQSPPGTYDVILSDAEFVQQLNAAGYITPLEAADYPIDDFFPEFKQFPGHWKDGKLYSAMVRYGHLGVSYNTTKVSPEEAMSYKAFWKPDLKGKVGHFDWHLPSLGMMSLLEGNAKPSPFDISKEAWTKAKATTETLKPQVGGFYDYGGTFSNLKTGQMWAMCGIGDWITGVLKKDGAPVDSVVPKEGGIQWTESYCIGKGSAKADIARKFIQYMLSPEGQVKSAKMAAYPAMLPTKKGWTALAAADPGEAKRQGMMDGLPNNPLSMLKDGRIHYRGIPAKQSLEEWNEFWQEYKSA